MWKVSSEVAERAPDFKLRSPCISLMVTMSSLERGTEEWGQLNLNPIQDFVA